MLAGDEGTARAGVAPGLGVAMATGSGAWSRRAPAPHATPRAVANTAATRTLDDMAAGSRSTRRLSTPRRTPSASAQGPDVMTLGCGGMLLATASGMRTLPTALVAILLASTAVGCVASEGDSSFTIANRSSYFLEEIHLAEVSDPTWGPDLIAGALAPGQDLIITGIDCGTYDVLVVDETGVDCELSNIDLCFDDDGWVIDDFTLDVCAFNAVQ